MSRKFCYFCNPTHPTNNKIMKTSYLFLAPGFEETEAIATVDTMRRAGMPVKTVAVADTSAVSGAHGVTIVADTLIGDADLADAEWLICPGGLPGATNLAESKAVTDVLKSHASRGGLIAAICASPAVVLAPLGILDGKEATCYPGFEDKCPGAKMIQVPVVSQSTLVTGNGPASTLKFALAIVAHSLGEGIAKEVAAGMLCAK